jgi:uncharacterized membrane protein YdbT with pleckstrin-like domain
MSDSNVPPHETNDLLVPGGPSRPASSDKVIYNGPVSMWMGIKTFALAAIVEIIAIALMVYGLMHREGQFGNIPVIVGGALLIASNAMLAYTILIIKTQRYKISHKLIEREYGILVKRVDSLDLGRVKDVELAQSLFQRMLGIGTIEVFSSDKTDPVMLIESLPNPRPIYEQLRDAMIEISQRRGIVPMG